MQGLVKHRTGIPWRATIDHPDPHQLGPFVCCAQAAVMNENLNVVRKVWMKTGLQFGVFTPWRHGFHKFHVRRVWKSKLIARNRARI